MKRICLPRACKRVTPPPCSNPVPKKNKRTIRKVREAIMASVTQDGNNNAMSLNKKTPEEANPAVTEALGKASNSAEISAVPISTERTAVTARVVITSLSKKTLSSAVCHTTMVHAQPLAAESTCNTNRPHTKGKNGIRNSHSHIAYPLRPAVRDFSSQTDLLDITDDDMMFLKNLKAKRMDISKINVIVKNNEYIVSYIEPEESCRWEYMRMQNGELPDYGLAEWERNQMELEALSLALDLQNMNPNLPE